ncbi:hypothetical protein FPV67DRAFT_1213280 [Lyophyllum atratum]|nr:hypothetical protein FPV67DRAFT_1213280 [Lyophyllum atratum]
MSSMNATKASHVPTPSPVSVAPPPYTDIDDQPPLEPGWQQTSQPTSLTSPPTTSTAELSAQHQTIPSSTAPTSRPELPQPQSHPLSQPNLHASQPAQSPPHPTQTTSSPPPGEQHQAAHAPRPEWHQTPLSQGHPTPQPNSHGAPQSAWMPSQPTQEMSAPALGEQYRAAQFARCAQGNHSRKTKYGVCGIITAVILFPFGLVCLFLDKDEVCTICGNKL